MKHVSKVSGFNRASYYLYLISYTSRKIIPSRDSRRLGIGYMLYSLDNLRIYPSRENGFLGMITGFIIILSTMVILVYILSTSREYPDSR